MGTLIQQLVRIYNELVQTLWEKIWYDVLLLNVYISCNPPIPLLGIYPRKPLVHEHPKPHVRAFITKLMKNIN